MFSNSLFAIPRHLFHQMLSTRYWWTWYFHTRPRDQSVPSHLHRARRLAPNPDDLALDSPRNHESPAQPSANPNQYCSSSTPNSFPTILWLSSWNWSARYCKNVWFLIVLGYSTIIADYSKLSVTQTMTSHPLEFLGTLWFHLFVWLTVWESIIRPCWARRHHRTSGRSCRAFSILMTLEFCWG